MRKIVFVFACLIGIATLHAQTLYCTASSGGANGGGTICKLEKSTGKLTTAFSFDAPDGFYPQYNNLTQANDGKMYGMISGGGSNGGGILSSYNPATAAYTKLMDFTTVTGDGSQGSLIQASDGNLYGMTFSGGTYDKGVLFSYNPATTVYNKLFDFDSTNGSYPYGSLVQAKDGKLYGMTTYGGNHNDGVIFSFNLSTAIYTKLKDLNAATGSHPYGNLMQATDGKLYGMTNDGGINNSGVVFSFNTVNAAYTTIIEFNFTNGDYPYGSLMQATDGKLYGMTYRGGTYGYGVLFSYNLTSATYSKLKDFDFYQSYPYGNLIQAIDGKLYGMTSTGGNYQAGVIFSYNTVTATYAKLWDFGGSRNGNIPYGSLVQATDGKLYGMTFLGGLAGYGNLFSFEINNLTYTNLRDFGRNNTGYDVVGNLAADVSGKLYGMTRYGGDSAKGVLFSYNPATASYTKIIDFNGNNGENPYGGLILADDSKFYGMTPYGNYSAGSNGTIFSYNPATNIFTKLKDFEYANGATPYGNLVQATNGKLYGMTAYGGTNGVGVIFSFDLNTAAYTKLIDFNGINGKRPYGSLTQATNGKLYGMTYYGGNNDKGIIFSFDASTATFTKLKDFDSTNGSYPFGSLIQTANGKLYGMTAHGGSKDSGVLFSYDPVTAVYTKIVTFYSNKGSFPIGSLSLASDGKLYGTTLYGGADNFGVAFSFDPVTSAYKKIQDFDGTNGKYPEYTIFTEVTSPVRIKINNVSLQEGNSGTTTMNFTVTLSKAAQQTVTVGYKTKNGTATAPTDYVAKTGTLTFAPGVKKQTITVLINGDTQVEENEQFKVLLGNAVNATIADSIGIGTILNDDAGFTLLPVERNVINSQLSIAVAPNPASNIVNVQLRGYTESTTLQLVDLQGKVLKEIKLQTSTMNNAQHSFDVTGIASGTYLVIALDEKGNRQMSKVVVIH